MKTRAFIRVHTRSYVHTFIRAESAESAALADGRKGRFEPLSLPHRALVVAPGARWF